MIKSCPSCNRTYSDDSISFCLADGALLSAPFDTGREEPPPTEVLLPPTRAVSPPTQSANAALPTITSLPEFRRTTTPEDLSSQKNSAITLIVLALGAMALIAGGVLAVRYAWPQNRQSAGTSSEPSPLVAVNSTPSPAGPGIGSGKPADKSQLDPGLSPGDEKQMNAPEAPSSADASKVFSSGEVERKVKILSKPEPTYTAEARQNQINGTVVLRAVFSASGDVTDIHAVSGLPDGLTERAIAAAKQIKFVPAMKDGRPVSVSMQLQYNFNLY
jgi:TonB family protein